MKHIIKTFTLALGLAVGVSGANAQNLTPQPSSGQTIEQGFGLGKVILSYSRPNIKGRKVFGNLVPFGTVWRTGANSATTLTFTDDVTIGDQKVPAGKYGLFTIPGENEWTIIISKTDKQWGAYAYKEADDLLRIKVKSSKLPQALETFTMQFANVKAGSMELHLMWDKTAVSIPFSVDFDEKVMANINKAMQSDKKPYFAAAQYYYENNKDLNQALEWVSEAEKTDAKAPWYKVWKARIQLKMGDKKGALQTATQGLAIAKEIKNDEYTKLSQEIIDQTK